MMCWTCRSKKQNKVSNAGAATQPPAEASKPTAAQVPAAQPVPTTKPVPAAAPAPATQPAATTPPSTMATCKIAVLYYSTYGHIAQVRVDLMTCRWRLHPAHDCASAFPSAVHTRTLDLRLNLVDLPVQLAKKELEGALSVDGVEATLLRVRLRTSTACMLSVWLLRCSYTYGETASTL